MPCAPLPVQQDNQWLHQEGPPSGRQQGARGAAITLVCTRGEPTAHLHADQHQAGLAHRSNCNQSLRSGPRQAFSSHMGDVRDANP